MIKAEQIPDEVWRALQLATGMGETAARGLVAIMINKWPGMWKERPLEHEYLCLPFSQESGNE